MDKWDKRALVLALIDALRASGSRCGETHVQKSFYVLQTMSKVPSNFNFILYKHGPFSFDLQEFLHELRGDNLIADMPTGLPYGTMLAVTPQGKQIESLRADLINRYKRLFQTISERFGKKTVRDLERIATAFYVMQELPKSSVKDQAQRITFHKKHVRLDEAEQALVEANDLLKLLATA